MFGVMSVGSTTIRFCVASAQGRNQQKGQKVRSNTLGEKRRSGKGRGAECVDVPVTHMKYLWY